MKKFHDILNKVRKPIKDEFGPKCSALTCPLKFYRDYCEIKQILMGILKNSKILDFGCGNGAQAALLSTIRPDLKIFGMDINFDQTVTRALRKGFNYESIVGDCMSPPFEENIFDYIFSFGVLEHVKSDSKFIKEIYRILKKGGKIFIFNLPRRYSIVELFLENFYKSLSFHKRRYMEREIKGMFERIGFKNIKIKESNIIPAEFEKMNKFLGEFVNKNFYILDKIDRFLLKTPVKYISQSLTVFCEK